MSTCNFSIPFTGRADAIHEKAKSAVKMLNGDFEGDLATGSFAVTVFSNLIKGTYQVVGQTLHLKITEKPVLMPCNLIENLLKSKIS